MVSLIFFPSYINFNIFKYIKNTLKIQSNNI